MQLRVEPLRPGAELRLLALEDELCRAARRIAVVVVVLLLQVVEHHRRYVEARRAAAGEEGGALAARREAPPPASIAVEAPAAGETRGSHCSNETRSVSS